MHSFSVGKPYNPAITNWPEGTQYNCRQGAHEFIIALRKPTYTEIEDFKQGTVQAGYYEYRGIIFFLLKARAVKRCAWLDAPYHYSRLSEQDAVLPTPGVDIGKETQVLLNMFLLDVQGGKGVISAMRIVSMQQALAAPLHEAIREQSVQPMTNEEYSAAIDDAYRTYTTDQMAALAGQQQHLFVLGNRHL